MSNNTQSNTQEQPKSYIYSDIKEIKRAVLYLAKCFDNLSKKQSSTDNSEFLVDLIELKVSALEKSIDKKFKMLAAGQAYEYGLFESEFEQYRKEFLAKMQEDARKERERLFEIKLNGLKALIESIQHAKEFFNSSNILFEGDEKMQAKYYLMKLYYFYEEAQNLYSVLKKV